MRNTKAILLILAFLLVNLCLWAQGPSADFSSDITSGCSPIIVNFQDKSGGNITSWKWDFGNGATSTRQNPSTTYITAGTFTVTLIVSSEEKIDTIVNTIYDTIVKTAYITTYGGPNVNFINDKTSSCAPGSIQFTDRSTPDSGTTNTSWSWDFGDGNTSTEQNPSHTYTSSGVYSVLLRVTNDKGCVKLLPKNNLITIFEGVTPAFSNSTPDLCRAPATVNFTNESAGPGTLSYTWLFGDGATAQGSSASHTYTQEGSFPVSLIVSSSLGCIDTLTKENAVVIGGTMSDFTTSSLCASSNITFNNTSTPAPLNFQWQFPDGSTSTQVSPVMSFDSAGSYTIRLINEFENCTDTIVKTIELSGKPTIDFTTADSTNCQVPALVNFQNQTPDGASFEWDFGDGNTSTEANPSHNYSDFGQFNVRLIVTNAAGCTDTLTKTAFIRIEKPVITFRNLPERGCIPYTINPVAVVNSLDSVVSYEWNFGDGGTATGQFPAYTYTRQGTYPVSLTITTTKGCKETFTLDAAVKVGTKPKADFTVSATDICASEPVTFTNNSPAPTDEYFWDFDDGSTSTMRSPVHQFNDTGSLSITLIAYNSGCGDTMVQKDLIYVRPPISKFTFKPNCDNRLEYTFTDESIGALSWNWNFGDGSPAVSEKTPAPHRFPRRGSYNVSLTTTNGACSFTQTTTVSIVDQTPDFTASSQVGCKTFRPTFSASSPVQVTAYQWTFGNGESSETARPSPTYTNTGMYDVTLTTTDIYGCKDTRTKANYIRVMGPTASFSSNITRGCIGLNTTFTDTSATDGTNQVVKWQWNFGDGIGQSSDRTPAYTYDTTGFFTVKLIVEDAAGCKDSITKNNYIQVSDIKASWESVKESCPQAPVAFRNTTAGNYTSIWSFGDSTTSPDRSPRHAYADTGLYTISLVVRDSVGCTDTLTRENHLRIGQPVASFTANNLITYCTPFEAKFTNTSQYYNSFVWRFQSGTSRTLNPSTYYTSSGTDQITLTVTSPGGCRDSVTQALQVRSMADARLTYGPLTGCAPTTVNMQGFDSLNAKFTWDFGDGNVVDTTVNKVSHVYTDFGRFVPRLIIEEQCVVALSGREVINIYGVDAQFEPDRNLICDTGFVVFNDSTTFNDPIRSYRWDFGDGSFSSQQSPSHFYDRPGEYTVKLNVQTQQGCVDSASFSTIKVSLTPRIATTGDTSICLGEFVKYEGRFTRSDTSVVRWLWQFPNGNSSSAQNPITQFFKEAGSYQVRTLVTNSDGCQDSAFLPLHVHPIPTITQPGTLSINNGGSLTIPITYSPNVVRYEWSPAQGLSCTDCPQPVASPRFSTQYKVEVTDENGCRNVGQVHVAVLCKNAEVFIPNTFTPNGDGSNDIFYVRGKGIERVKSFRIFNRWGEVVFEKVEIPANIESPMYGWDGRYKGAKAYPEVYVYQVEVYCDNGEILRFQGNVALVL